jgi:hypothetical protein
MSTSASLPSAAPKWSDDQTIAAVRRPIRALLEHSAAFRRLAPKQRKDLAEKMVKVSAYLANPEGVVTEAIDSEKAKAKRPLALAQDDPVTTAANRAASSPGFAGKDFEAGAVKQGIQQFGELVKKVDFSNFVSGLIQNVFKAIVDSSIQQMQAYGELLANVAKTVDQFAQDNLTQNNARDWLAQKYPKMLGIDVSQADSGFGDTSGGTSASPILVAKGDDSESDLKSISTDLGLEQPITDISDPDQEQALVLKARLQMARQRQQLLSSMVVLGINRIVVTDGLIHAKVVFDVQANDAARRGSRASLYDSKDDYSSSTEAIGGWLPIGIGGGAGSTSSNDHLTTVQSSLDETSESKAQVKANLTGEVRVNFKSDYFPMDKLASPEMIAAIQGNAVPKDKPARPAASGATTPPTPAAAPAAAPAAKA